MECWISRRGRKQISRRGHKRISRRGQKRISRRGRKRISRRGRQRISRRGRKRMWPRWVVKTFFHSAPGLLSGEPWGVGSQKASRGSFHWNCATRRAYSLIPPRDALLCLLTTSPSQEPTQQNNGSFRICDAPLPWTMRSPLPCLDDDALSLAAFPGGVQPVVHTTTQIVVFGHVQTRSSMGALTRRAKHRHMAAGSASGQFARRNLNHEEESADGRTP